VDGHEGYRKEISSERIGAPDMVNCFGGAQGTVDYFEGILGLIVREELQASSIFVFFGV